jgi:hypothetical protein
MRPTRRSFVRTNGALLSISALVRWLVPTFNAQSLLFPETDTASTRTVTLQRGSGLFRKPFGVSEGLAPHSMLTAAPQRFLAQDPLGCAAGDPNLYVYASNAPQVYTDPMGLKPSPQFGGPPPPPPSGPPGASGPSRSGPPPPGPRPGPNPPPNDPPKPADDRFQECMRSCLNDMFRQNLSRYGRNLGRSAVTAPIVGVGTCGLIVISEPYLAPTFLQCTGVATASTAALFWAISQGVFNIEMLSAVAGCAAGCGGW